MCNMTPKEKAKELYFKMMQHSFGGDSEQSIQCALIAVDEIINVCGEDESAIITQIQYWQEVKNQLLNL